MKTIAKAFSKLCCEFTINANKGLIKAEQACNSMQNRLNNSLKKLDEGAVTAEYAVVLIAATAFATVLIAIAKSDAVHTAIGELVKRALHVS
ncbi:DUF4244 domain-containing protein [Gardnerella vaginalis]|uniref:DUF4244 domain-containing protein n=1 Tax=Gardnerella vaginalis TaxID=2702 RepID=UPI00200BB7EA|nr:DUF4244 domain-containing protein [Gardnerella vaginalis]UQA80151.1 DUF4244 domain-containing protein [Gardnerella vaginalis]